MRHLVRMLIIGVVVGSEWAASVLSSQFCCESETALKDLSLFFFFKASLQVSRLQRAGAWGSSTVVTRELANRKRTIAEY